ncbi:hypothetical protein [Labrenzia sp. PHM005]|uniref:hypothetical protein n=1 Tax=Labrenzia sp. PHM005 TaxID=2590016 RepID=UPI00113FF531|nr:hypothetical protein [Labrenzia sp. PHM005]QDG75576.1 hypothetical protein FJ695_06690 [Labrenzia sp. PHM005]
MDFEDEYFGTAAQITVSRRARDLWKLVRNDPRFSYNGRIVAVAGDVGDETADKLAVLARLQGSTTCHFLPKEKEEIVQRSVKKQGLATNVWEFCKGGKLAYEMAQDVLTQYQLPSDLSVTTLCESTDPSFVRDFALMVGECGVLVMAGRVMRGVDIPGITLAAVDGSGKVIASAWGYKCYHPQSPFSDHAFWGGLTCHVDRRGQKIALILGALSIVQLWEKLDVRGVCTGIARDNTASFALCEKLNVLKSDQIGLGVSDPKMFQGATLTK